jgi:hypothetical protein
MAILAMNISSDGKRESKPTMYLFEDLHKTACVSRLSMNMRELD